MPQRLLALLLCAALFIPSCALAEDTTPEPERFVAPTLPPDAIAWDSSHPDILDEDMLYARSAILIEADTGEVLFEKNADEIMYPASTTKIMTAYIALQMGDMDNDVVTVSQNAIDLVPPTYQTIPLSAGEQVPLLDLISVMLIRSGNEAANAIAEFLSGSVESFADLMNQTAQMLGCSSSTHFANPSGVHDENHYTTAREMATITEYALTMPYFTDVTSQTYYTQPPTNMTSEERTVTTTNRMLLSYDDEYYTYATGVKTGSLNESGYCISATATYGGYSYLVVCMGSPYIDSEGNHIDYHGEMYDAATLFRWAFLNIENKTLVTDGELLGEVSLKYAWGKDRLQVLAQGNLTATLPSSLESGAITTKLDLPESVKAPIKKGDYVGTATFYYNGAELSTVALVAAESVERSEIVQVLQQGQEVLTSTWFIVTATILLVLAAAYAILAILMNRKNKKVRRVKKYRDL